MTSGHYFNAIKLQVLTRTLCKKRFLVTFIAMITSPTIHMAVPHMHFRYSLPFCHQFPEHVDILSFISTLRKMECILTLTLVIIVYFNVFNAYLYVLRIVEVTTP